ncbi:calponin homology domain-containing protein DDB_G0272472-like [Centruroides vittatus]|uniref:calponin homology domain-containing protein DDB_G0272472-like n=1 Tax=Centruroides vittatus TaxID=120091 RepID=UPI003510C52C
MNFDEKRLAVLPGKKSFRVLRKNLNLSDLVKAIREVIKEAEIAQICRLPGGTEVTMKNPEDKWTVLEKGLKIDNRFLLLESCDDKCKRIVLNKVPGEMEKEDVYRLVEEYGIVKTYFEETYKEFPMILTGRRILLIETSKKIPNLIKVKDRIIEVNYPGMVRQCVECFKEGHIRSKCPEIRCLICNLVGHRKKDCRQAGSGTGEKEINEGNMNIENTETEGSDKTVEWEVEVKSVGSSENNLIIDTSVEEIKVETVEESKDYMKEKKKLGEKIGRKEKKFEEVKNNTDKAVKRIGSEVKNDGKRQKVSEKLETRKRQKEKEENEKAKKSRSVGREDWRKCHLLSTYVISYGGCTLRRSLEQLRKEGWQEEELKLFSASVKTADLVEKKKLKAEIFRRLIRREHDKNSFGAKVISKYEEFKMIS